MVFCCCQRTAATATCLHPHAPACCRYDFVIVSYDMLKDVAQVLEAIQFKVVILDESHCIKSPQVRTSLTWYGTK